ncbi:hypothetical protein DTO021C3_4559 [Paecilomyces variotii]|nr:hypothetical protein DTO021C3_4559 [Paecilomyces variotii]
MASAVGGSELENNATPTDETTKVVTAMGPRSGSSPQLTVQDDGENYPSGPKFWLIGAALGLGGFLVSFDSTVLSTAVPVISDEFHSLGDIGWYSSVYFLAMCTPQMVLVKLNGRYPIRWNYGIAMALFIAGSALCGAAPNSPVLIAGRALAGLGSSGLLASSAAMVPFLAPPSERPTLFGLFAGAMGLGVGSGPLIGGALTETVTWRWNFYMNIPIGAVIYAIFYLTVHPQKPDYSTPWRSFLRTLDLLGLATFASATACLLIALQWGGTTYPWADVRVIVLLVLSGVLAVIFLVVEFWLGDSAMLPRRIFSKRNVWCAVWFCFCGNGAAVVLTYYLPIWFQGVQGDTPVLSGVHTLPLVVTTVFTTILGGILITLFGHVGPFMVAGSIFMAVGAGLLTTLDSNTSVSKWIGYQIIYALGAAFGRQCPSVCLQNLLPEKDAPLAYTLVTFISFVAGAIFVSTAQALFSNRLVSGLEGLGMSKAEATASLAKGVTSVSQGLSDDAKTAVLHVLNTSIVNAWRLPVALSCMSIIGALVLEHQKVKGKPNI